MRVRSLGSPVRESEDDMTKNDLRNEMVDAVNEARARLADDRGNEALLNALLLAEQRLAVIDSLTATR